MLFEKDIEPRCAYCKRGSLLGEDQVMCLKRGIMSAAGSCRAFRYDPLKRVPPKPLHPDFSKLRDEDFVWGGSGETPRRDDPDGGFHLLQTLAVWGVALLDVDLPGTQLLDSDFQ